MIPERAPIRIGDRERDEAVAALGEHVAAGRLERTELEERLERALSARVEGDLRPLFDDLPHPPDVAAEPRSAADLAGLSRRLPPPRQGRPGGGHVRGPVLLLAPALLLVPLVIASAVLTATVALGGPWMVLWAVMVWVLISSGRRRHRGHAYRGHAYRGHAYHGGPPWGGYGAVHLEPGRIEHVHGRSPLAPRNGIRTP